jgi:hypothetical protein
MDMVAALFEKALKLDPPWEVNKIDLDESKKTIIYLITGKLDFSKTGLPT